MLKRIFIKIIRFYQLTISPHLSKSCRFYPSCSEYSIQAIEKKGVVKGIIFGLWRILRCNPLSHGGVDIL
ncbi:MAG: membrane protein insertion efficiency factor YidD [Candidatus Pacebacteria bacterium]|nr:membrane protein insertion efficiency factor YidD [Candidatus Paceibacterota bacterium]